MNTFSNHFFKMTIAAGLLFGALGVCSSLQRLNVTAQRSHASSNFPMQLLIGSISRENLKWISAPISVKFNPIPNPEPSGTGGTGTR